MSLPATFLDKVQVSTGCLIWTGATRSGYGAFWQDGKVYRAHRLAYEAAYGPVPDGLVLDHLCRVKLCVNVEHLEAVTQAENLRRGARPRRTHCMRGHAFDEENTYVRQDGTRNCRACSRFLDRSKPTVHTAPIEERTDLK